MCAHTGKHTHTLLSRLPFDFVLKNARDTKIAPGWDPASRSKFQTSDYRKYRGQRNRLSRTLRMPTAGVGNHRTMHELS